MGCVIGREPWNRWIGEQRCNIVMHQSLTSQQLADSNEPAMKRCVWSHDGVTSFLAILLPNSAAVNFFLPRGADIEELTSSNNIFENP